MIPTTKLSPSLRHARVSIVFLQMGGPKTLDDIESFLKNLFSDPDIIHLPFFMKPFQSLLAKVIAKKRTPHVKELYAQIGSGSPIFNNTAQFAKTVENTLNPYFEAIKTFIIMRYSPPRAEQVIHEILSYNPTHLIVFTLYPHYSITTTGSSINDWKRHLKRYAPRLSGNTKIIEVMDWSTLPCYLAWWEQHITSQYRQLNPDEQQKTAILFSAHSIPESYAKKGDPYRVRVTQAFNLITKHLHEQGVQAATYLSFQSSVGPVKWLQPETQAMIPKLRAEGYTALIMVPLGFVSEHLETLYEMDILYKKHAENAGFTTFIRIPTPNTNPQFIQEISSYLLQVLEENHDKP